MAAPTVASVCSHPPTKPTFYDGRRRSVARVDVGRGRRQQVGPFRVRRGLPFGLYGSSASGRPGRRLRRTAAIFEFGAVGPRGPADWRLSRPSSVREPPLFARTAAACCLTDWGAPSPQATTSGRPEVAFRGRAHSALPAGAASGERRRRRVLNPGQRRRTPARVGAGGPHTKAAAKRPPLEGRRGDEGAASALSLSCRLSMPAWRVPRRMGSASWPCHPRDPSIGCVWLSRCRGVDHPCVDSGRWAHHWQTPPHRRWRRRGADRRAVWGPADPQGCSLWSARPPPDFHQASVGVGATAGSTEPWRTGGGGGDPLGIVRGQDEDGQEGHEPGENGQTVLCTRKKPEQEEKLLREGERH